MKPFLLYSSLIFAALFLGHISAQEGISAAYCPRYKILYENGEYDAAIALLEDSLASDTSNQEQRLFHLASCYIARGDRDNGAVVFKRLIKIAPTYQLDTLLTPPKILEIFRTVRSQEKPAGIKTLQLDAKPSALLMVPLGFVPGGAGQFYRRERLKGALLLATQAASVAVCVWSGWKKDQKYDRNYGWYEGNKAAYERYTNYARIGFGIFIGSYTLGVMDYFFNSKKQ